MKPEDKEIFNKLNSLETMTLTLYAEGRGEPHDGQLAVCYIILNRSQKWKQGIKEICYAPNQFSCYNSNDKQYPKLVEIADNFDKALSENQSLRKCYEVAYMTLSAMGESIIGDATFYRVIGTKNKWFDGAIKSGVLVKVCEIKNHEFFREA
jgi:spore germination cell wall hydrolase CwlJ-like protein